MEPLTGAGAAKGKAQKSKPAKEELLTSSHEEAKELCRWARVIGTLAPWEWMEETDLFGVQDPVTGEIGFVSVMGALGEYRAIAVYRGIEGLLGWIDFHSALELDPELPDAARLLLETPHLHVSFSDSALFEKRDRDLLKGVGLKFTGGRPLFRSSRPGYHPWYVTREEARLLIHTLSQTFIIAERLAEDPDSLVFSEDGEHATFLVRVSHEQGSDNHPSGYGTPAEMLGRGPRSAPPGTPELVWEDRIQKISLRRPQMVPLAIEAAVLSKLQRLTQTQLEMEADLFMGPGAVGKRGDRPAAIYMLMLADHESGFIFGFEAMAAEQGLAAMYADAANRLARFFLKAQLLPKRLMIRSDRLFELLEPLTQKLNIELFRADELPAIEEAAEAIFEQFGSGR
jgi:hypothetical protein